jgi:hypothetical protein
MPPLTKANLCRCIVLSLSSFDNSPLSKNETAVVSNSVCDLDSSSCNGISANYSTNAYGWYSICDAYSQLLSCFSFIKSKPKQRSTNSHVILVETPRYRLGRRIILLITSQSSWLHRTETVENGPTGTGLSSNLCIKVCYYGNHTPSRSSIGLSWT